jgi:KDO2-lipid IV(A) lauroyltransferase
MAAYWFMRIAAVLVRWVPLGVSYAVAAFLGRLYFLLSPGWRQHSIEAMRTVLGPGASEPEIRSTARRSVENYGRYLVDFLRFPHLTPEQIDRACDVDDEERVRRALAGDRGIVFVTMHFGNWDMAGGWLARHRPIHVIAETFSHSKLNDFVQGTRARLGMRVWAMEGSIVSLMRAIRNREIMAILIDRQDPNGIPVRFFNGVLRLPQGAAALILKSGARPVTGGMVSNGDGTYHALFDDTLEVRRTGDEKQDIAHLTQEIVSSLESFIRRYPDQWYVFRPMFTGESVDNLDHPWLAPKRQTV